MEWQYIKRRLMEKHLRKNNKIMMEKIMMENAPAQKNKRKRCKMMMEWQYIKRRLMEKAPAQKQHPQRHQRLHPRWYQPQLTMMMFIMIQYNCKQNFQKDKFTYCIAIGSVMIVKKHQNLNHFDDLEAMCWLVLLANPCGHICYIIWKIQTLKGKLGETFLSGQSLAPLGEVYYTVYKRVLSS